MIRKALPYPLDHGEDSVFDEHFQLCCVLVKFWGSKEIPELPNVLLENIPRFPISYELISLSEKRFIILRALLKDPPPCMVLDLPHKDIRAKILHSIGFF